MLSNNSPPMDDLEENDPWLDMEAEAGTMMQDLANRIENYNTNTNPSIFDENGLLDAITRCTETIEEMQSWLDTARKQPESFNITSDELQRRSEFLKSFTPTLTRARQIRTTVQTNQRKRIMSQGKGGVKTQNSEDDLLDNNQFLRREHETQRAVAQQDEETLDRLHGGIHRVKETAVNIQEELATQEHMLGDIDEGMTRVQMRLDSAIKKVGKLIDSTSDRTKMICIAVLMVILILLVVFVVK